MRSDLGASGFPKHCLSFRALPFDVAHTALGLIASPHSFVSVLLKLYLSPGSLFWPIISIRFFQYEVLLSVDCVGFH